MLSPHSKSGATTDRAGKDEGISPESAFLEIVRREVRRSERSGRPFVLAFIRSDFNRDKSARSTVSALAAGIKACTRETDWIGWYEHDKVLGIALTEIGEASDQVIKLLIEKISLAMREAVGAEGIGSLELSIRLFPDDAGLEADDGSNDGTYRELHSRLNRRSPDLMTKRVIDVAGSLAAIALFAPLFVVLAVLVKLSSPGPVLFRQKRVGQYGVLFDFYKLRSMYINNDAGLHEEYVDQLINGSHDARQSNGMYKIVHDPRVTRIGRFLRKSSLDELPQFFNVLRGEMSLVGPRPPLPYEVRRYKAWHRRRVLDLKPGLTGLWQVNGRSRTTFDEMVRLDLCYMRTRSLWLDLKIILKTPLAMFNGSGAY